MDYLDLMQWPAMLLTVLAAWLVGSLKKYKRIYGFIAFLVSNVLWVIWGWHAHAYAVIALQFCLAGLNIRGIIKNESQA